MPIGEKAPRADKVQEVEELKGILGSGTLILADYQGLDVKTISGLRKKLREAGSGLRVVKNKLFIRAADGTAAVPLTEDLQGPTAIVYTDDDPVAAAKALVEFAKTAKQISVKSGLVEGAMYDADQITALSKVPSKPELYAMVVGGLQGPITGLVGTLQSMIGGLVMTLQAVADGKEAA